MIQPLIWVEGIIGVGKTTAVEELGKRLQSRVFYEPVNDELLKIYYEDQFRWGFSFQINMLHKRYGIQSLAAQEAKDGRSAIIDRGLPGDRVFAQMLMRDKKIHSIDWEIYEHAYDMVIQLLTPPDLLIFLDVSPEVAYERIKLRNREAESNSLLPLSYLKRLQSEYRELLDEIYSGNHAWSSRMEVWEIDWNEDWQSFDPIVENIHTLTRILNFFNQEKIFSSSDEQDHIKAIL